ncbi:MAG: citrate transporter [Anaerotignum sp.]|nr:citrate transporter [Anaerotignum sp.]
MNKEKLIAFFKKETILCISGILAFVSAFIIPPDAGYMEYCDFKVLILLFCLMAVMGGFQQLGVFDRMANLLLARARKMRQLATTLVMLCFFSAMFVTNDVALITFVPFTIMLLERANLREKMIPIIVLQTIAANLGSMLTPVGNPQNLFLYTISGMGMGEFFAITLPYVGVSYFFLYVLCYLQGRTPLQTEKQEPKRQWTSHDKGFLVALGLLFILCLLAVFHLAPHQVVLVVILVWFIFFQKGILKDLDYNLLLTFIFFFILIGNLGRISAVRNTLQELLLGREVIVSFLASQFISNVPAAVLLSEFTDSYASLIAGVNIGGLGTLIASMASLISYKYYAQAEGARKGKYMIHFTIWNIIFAVVLLAVNYFLPYLPEVPLGHLPDFPFI